MTKAMVLAAGVGSRLEPVSHHIPKPLVPVLNIPVISHILYGLQKHGINEVIANTHYLADTLSEYFQKNSPEGISVELLEEKELSGDAGGVRACRAFLDSETFVVIMGDLLTNADISRLLMAHKEKGAIATIGLKRVENVSRFGVARRDQDGFIKEFQEKPEPGREISNDISTGIYILEPEVFEHIPKSGVYGFGRQLFPLLVKKGLKVLGENIDGYWSDIGTLTDLYKANMEALNGKFQLARKAPECKQDFPDIKFEGTYLLGEKLQIGKNSMIGNNCIIGNDSVIGENVQLKNCLVFSDSQIESGSIIENCIFAFGELIPLELRAASRG